MPSIPSDLIAPCGMNCALCSGFQRVKNKCSGCRATDGSLPTYCEKCIIRNCEKLNSNGWTTCAQCDTIPCKRLKALDKRYHTKYHMSMLDNLDMIRSQGMDAFVENEGKRWTCPECGEMICVHHHGCDACGEKLVE